MHIHRLAFLGSLAISSVALGQDSYKVEPLKQEPPASLAAPIRDAVQPQGYRVVGADGKPFAEVWARKAMPASAKPAGPKGAVLLPNLAEGELLGVLRFLSEGHDYRDQSIPPGAYTLRYGLQPVNGDHLGVSVFRDFALLIPASKDKELAAPAKKTIETRSAEAAGSSHPAILMLQPVPDEAKPPAVVHDQEKNLWGAVFTIPLAVKGESAAVNMPVQLVIVGAAMP
jgi:hypothetical protein